MRQKMEQQTKLTCLSGASIFFFKARLINSLNIKIISLVMISILTVCAVQGQKLKVKNLSEGGASKGTVYALPQTVVSVSIEITRTVFKKGPYAEFASEYLGISDASRSDSSYSEISKINVTSYREADPEQYFVVDSKQKDLDESQFVQLKNEGLIIDAAGFKDQYKNLIFSGQKTDHQGLSYNDLSYESFFSEKMDTVYKTVKTDSTYKRIPMLKKQVERETLEEKAEEAADLIFKTRERRMKLVAGEFDFIPDGQSLQICINQLDKIENDYLSLFLGRTFKEVKTYGYDFTPHANQTDEQETLCYFSTEMGISSSIATNSLPLSLKISKIQTNSPLEKLSHKTSNVAKFSDQIIYRIPNLAELEVVLDKTKLLDNKIYIDQYGILVGY
jgi:hypothetical protein